MGLGDVSPDAPELTGILRHGNHRCAWTVLKLQKRTLLASLNEFNKPISVLLMVYKGRCQQGTLSEAVGGGVHSTQQHSHYTGVGCIIDQ